MTTQFEDIIYQKKEGVATVTINRPEVRNAFRPRTIDEMSFSWLGWVDLTDEEYNEELARRKALREADGATVAGLD